MQQQHGKLKLCGNAGPILGISPRLSSIRGPRGQSVQRDHALGCGTNLCGSFSAAQCQQHYSPCMASTASRHRSALPAAPALTPALDFRNPDVHPWPSSCPAPLPPAPRPHPSISPHPWCWNLDESRACTATAVPYTCSSRTSEVLPTSSGCRDSSGPGSKTCSMALEQHTVTSKAKQTEAALQTATHHRRQKIKHITKQLDPHLLPCADAAGQSKCLGGDPHRPGRSVCQHKGMG